MLDKPTVLRTVSSYLNLFPNETQRLARFTTFLAKNDDVFGRSNYSGHITTSAIILDRTRQRVLLVFHRTLSRFLQPGGHFEGDRSLSAGAVREAVEETGILRGELCPEFLVDEPIDIDTHSIPENSKRKEPSHLHFDFRFVFLTDEHVRLSVQRDEIANARWFNLQGETAVGALGGDLLGKLLRPTVPSKN